MTIVNNNDSATSASREVLSTVRCSDYRCTTDHFDCSSSIGFTFSYLTSLIAIGADCSILEIRSCCC